MGSVKGSNTAKGCGCAFLVVLIFVIGFFWWVIDESFGPSSGEVASDVKTLEKKAEQAGFPELVFDATGAGTYASITYRLTGGGMDFSRYTKLCNFLRDDLGGGYNGSSLHAEGISTTYRGVVVKGCPHVAFANLEPLEQADLKDIVGIDFSQSTTMPVVAWASMLTTHCSPGDVECARERGESAAEVLAVLMDGQDHSASGEGNDRPRVQIQSKVSPRKSSGSEVLDRERKETLYATVTVAGEPADLANSETTGKIVGDFMALNHSELVKERESGAGTESNSLNINKTAMKVDVTARKMQLAEVSLRNDAQRDHACRRSIPLTPALDELARKHGLTNGLDELREVCGMRKP